MKAWGITSSVLLAVITLSGCANESVSSTDTGTSPTYTAPTTTTPTTGTTTTTSSSSGSGSYWGSGTTVPSTSGSSITCPSGMTSIPAGSGQGAFCIDSAPGGGYNNVASLYWADTICTQAGKHLCQASEEARICELKQAGDPLITGGLTYIPGMWMKRSTAAVPNTSNVTGDITGATCAIGDVVHNANSQARGFYCCQ